MSKHVLVFWITLIAGMTANCQLTELDSGTGDSGLDAPKTATTTTAIMATDTTIVATNLVQPSTASSLVTSMRFSPHKTLVTITSTPSAEATESQETVVSHLYRVEPAPRTTEPILTPSSVLTPTATPMTQPRSSTRMPFTYFSRGDLPPQLDSEETTDGSDEPFLLWPTQTIFSPGNYPILRSPSENVTDATTISSGEDGPNLQGESVSDSPVRTPTMVSLSDDDSHDQGILEDGIGFTSRLTPSDSYVTDATAATANNTSTTTTATTSTTTTPDTTITTAPAATEDQHTVSNNIFDTFPEIKQMLPTTLPPEVITAFTSSPLQLHDKWTWFYMVLRGNCHFVDLGNSHILFYDFVKSLAALLLYNREHIIIDSMTCSGRRMTVNMSIDSIYYPNCEKDIRTLLTHRNLRINLHNTSFYIHSYETKRTLIFETKQDVQENESDEILYLTLGGVGISLLCIIFAGVLFTIYQYFVVKKTGMRNTVVSSRFMAESPRSLRPKYEIDQSMSYSDQRTYSVNMYKSYTDLTAPDLYSHLGLPSAPEPEKENSLKSSTILTRIPKEKNKKKKKKKNKFNSYGLNDCNAYQEYWSESITQTNEDLMTVRNLNTMTSSFKTNAAESDKDSLYPLLKRTMPMAVPKKSKRAYDEHPLPPPPPPPPPPLPTTCPSSPAISRSVLERMDQLISNEYSNSSPDINANNSYTRSYSNTMINISSASSSVFNNVASNTSCMNTDSQKMSTTKTVVAPTTSASADNLCLTRITFMEMCVWPQHSNPQLNFDEAQAMDQSHLV